MSKLSVWAVSSGAVTTAQALGFGFWNLDFWLDSDMLFGGTSGYTNLVWPPFINFSFGFGCWNFAKAVQICFLELSHHGNILLSVERLANLTDVFLFFSFLLIAIWQRISVTLFTKWIFIERLKGWVFFTVLCVHVHVLTCWLKFIVGEFHVKTFSLQSCTCTVMRKRRFSQDSVWSMKN